MATWLELARDNRKSASDLANLGYSRSAISRAYYASYLKLTHELALLGILMAGGREGPTHKKMRPLIETHFRHLRTEKRFALSQLTGRLYDLRIWADYFPSVLVNTADAREAVGLMKKIFDAF